MTLFGAKLFFPKIPQGVKFTPEQEKQINAMFLAHEKTQPPGR